jgi:hypothetical protein
LKIRRKTQIETVGRLFKKALRIMSTILRGGTPSGACRFARGARQTRIQKLFFRTRKGRKAVVYALNRFYYNLTGQKCQQFISPEIWRFFQHIA